jgi:hypothetical protein
MARWLGIGLLGLAAVVVIASVLAIILIDPTPAGMPKDCDVKVNAGGSSTAVDPPVTLTPTTQSTQRQLNFDTRRDPKRITRIVVTADQDLKFDKSALSFDAVLSRTGDTLESSDFPAPAFAGVTIHNDKRTVTFDACFAPAAIGAGKYVGSIELSGPPGVSSAAVNVTVNLKDGDLFWAGLIVALFASFALLLLKDTATAYNAQTTKSWPQALVVPLTDPRWWAATIVALGGAFGVLYAAYSADPAWGATGLAAAAALVGSAFAAIGGQSILTSFSTPPD